MSSAPSNPSPTPPETKAWTDFKLQRARQAFRIINPTYVDIGSDSIRQLWQYPQAEKLVNCSARIMDFKTASEEASVALKRKRQDEQKREATRKAMRSYLLRTENEGLVSTEEGEQERVDEKMQDVSKTTQKYLQMGHVCYGYDLDYMFRGKAQEGGKVLVKVGGKVQPISILKRK